MTASESIRPWQVLLLTALCLFIITPFVALCFYAHPSADDWYMAVGGRDLGFWGANWKWYTEISGRIIQQASTTLHPFLIGSLAYQVWCLVLLASLAGAGVHFGNHWLRGQQVAVRWLAAALGFSLFLWGMRSPAQGLYWVNGGNTYVLGFILQLIFGAWLARAWQEPEHRPSALISMAVLLMTMLASWCTELAMALQLVTLLLLAVAQWTEHRRVHRLFVVAIAGTLLASLVIFFSPGLPVRMGTYHNDVHGHLIPCLLLSAKLAVKQGVIWLTSAPFFLLALLLIGVWQAPAWERTQAWRRTVLVLLIMIGTTWGGFFIGAWGMGYSIPPRAINLLAAFFVVEWLALVFCVAALVRACGWARPALTPVTFALVILALGASLKAPNNVQSAWRDLLKGDARKFSAENERRYALLRESTTEEATVPPLRVKPVSLFFNDLKPDPTDWRNVGMADFFHKKAIHLSE